jgi:spermidine synthase
LAFPQLSTLWRRGGLYALFLCSGIPALLYQVVWQRSLLTVYGTDMLSVTMVVSAFMLGLGLGGLAGGWLCRLQRLSPLVIFGAVEIAVGLFGLGSLSLFDRIAATTVEAPLAARVLAIFLTLLVPTALMGATLPLLVRHLSRKHRSVAGSVGALYAANTLGAALACFSAAFFSMHWLGKSGSVRVAAALNLSIGTLALCQYVVQRHRGAWVPPVTGAASAAPARRPAMSFPAAALLTGVVGFMAMGYQVLWFRVYSFGSGGTSDAFALLLGFFLVGSSGGAATGGVLATRLHRVTAQQCLAIMGGLLLLGSLYAFALAPAAGRAVVAFTYVHSLALVTVATFLFGMTFPLIVHAAIPSDDARVGPRLGRLCFFSSAGAALGSVVVGYELMEAWSIAGITALLASGGVTCGIALLLRAQAGNGRRAAVAIAGAVLIVTVVSATTPLFDRLYERLQRRSTFVPDYQFARVIENRAGVITVTEHDTVFSSGVYDGRVNVDLEHDSNAIVRPYSMSLWHAAPRAVLMVGIGTGSWGQVLANHPQVERLSIVEINPGYLPLIASRAPVASLLSNPKVGIDIDSGRRWLQRHPDARFDVIVMNTTYHWRARATDVLSAEFFAIVRTHLNPGGVLFYNSTGGIEAQHTGLAVFPHGFRVGTFMAVSDSPIIFDWHRWQQTLRAYQIDGRPVFDFERPGHVRRFAEVTAPRVDRVDSQELEDATAIRARTAGSRIITDDNMGTEWRSPLMQRVRRVLPWP